MSEATATTTPTTVMQTLPDSVGESAPEGVSDPADPAASSGADSPVESPPAASLEIAKRFEAAKRAEVKAKRIEIEAQKQRAQVEQYVQHIQQQAQQLQAREAELARKFAEAESALEDPIGWAIRNGKDPAMLAERHFKPVTEHDKKIQTLEQRLEELLQSKQAEEKQRLEYEEQLKAQQQTKAFQQEMVEFVGSIVPDECPYLTSEYEAHEVPALVRSALNEHLETFVTEYGRNPYWNEIRDYLERTAKDRYHSRDKRVHPSLKSQPSNGGGQLESGLGHPATNGPGTLTNNHAAQSALGPSRKSKEERKRELVAQLEAASSLRTT